MTDHRVQRARERYGVDLTVRDIAALEATLSTANCLKAYGHEVVHLVRHSGVAMLVATKLIEGRQLIATFLPPDAFTSRARKAFRRSRAQ